MSRTRRVEAGPGRWEQEVGAIVGWGYIDSFRNNLGNQAYEDWAKWARWLCLHRSLWGFQTSCSQAILMYGIPSENELDLGKDVYDGRLVVIEDISSTNVEVGDEPPIGDEE